MTLDLPSCWPHTEIGAGGRSSPEAEARDPPRRPCPGRGDERSMRRQVLIGLILALAAVFWPWTVGAQQPTVRLLGQFTYPSKSTVQDTTVGGLSGLTYDAKRGVYYAVSDDRGENQASRFYTLQIDLDETGLKDVRVVGVTFLDSDASTPGVQPIERGDSDMEDIQLLTDDTLLIS